MMVLTPPRGELERSLREHVGRHARRYWKGDAQSDAMKLIVIDEVDSRSRGLGHVQPIRSVSNVNA